MLFLLFVFFLQKCDKSIFRQTFLVRSTQTLVKIYIKMTNLNKGASSNLNTHQSAIQIQPINLTYMSYQGIISCCLNQPRQVNTSFKNGAVEMECYATHQEGSNFVFFIALYWSCFGFNVLTALPTQAGGNKGIKSQKAAMKC